MTASPAAGVLLVDKPVGPTSHDVVVRARRALGERRIGHTGTLDPFASGLLVLCVGPATRLSPYLTGLDKEYMARARLGVSTDTLDREGEVTATDEGWRSLDRRAVEEALVGLRGTIRQQPPRYSAKKVGGTAAHRRARRGETVELEPVTVTVHALELTEVALPEVAFRVVCSSGTYIRALARDLGTALGVGAHLRELRRTAVGGFRVEEAVAGDFSDPVPDAAWRTPLQALAHLPEVALDDAAARRLTWGQAIPLPERLADPGGVGEVRVAVRHGDRLLAVGRVRDGVLRPERVLPPDGGRAG
ncbi:MAG: tRNA pseudouridine(55) synthase TruB [Longimicrobiales bacterium]|nr:tRNA pseudouridine(55) synthase TruB [Longimicrobiales bacterium]